MTLRETRLGTANLLSLLKDLDTLPPFHLLCFFLLLCPFCVFTQLFATASFELNKMTYKDSSTSCGETRVTY